jgi:DNA-binding NarL/FixJ family response regulator
MAWQPSSGVEEGAIVHMSEQRGGVAVREPGVGPISVFLADDVPELRELVRFGIEEDPAFEVVGEAGDGRAALGGISETTPAAVLLDLSMPDMDGFQAISAIRALQPQIAIVVLSGFSADRVKGKALEQGADAFVEKGTPMEQLRAITRSAVAERRSVA